MQVLSKEQILKSDDLKTELIEVPEWGGKIYVRTMTGKERDAFESLFLKSNKDGSIDNVRATLAAMTICDEKGERLFKDAEIKELGKKNAAALNRIFAASQKLNKLTEEDVKELTKN